MARKSARTSLLDKLKSGQVIVAEGGSGSSEGGVVVAEKPDAGPPPGSDGTDHAIAAGTGDVDELSPADAFGDDPEPTTGNTYDTGEGNGDASEPGRFDSRGRDASAPRGKASPNYGTKSKKTDLGFIEKSLVGIHAIVAAISKNEMWELTEDEAKNLAKALGKVQELYGIHLDPKTEAWIEVIGVAGAIYGPRVTVMMLMQGRGKKSDPIEQPAVQAATHTSGSVKPNGADKSRFSAVSVPSQMMPPGWGGGGEDNG